MAKDRTGVSHGQGHSVFDGERLTGGFSGAIKPGFSVR
jgi:hypothetical protein